MGKRIEKAQRAAHIPLETAGFEGYFVPELVPKSKSQFSSVIGAKYV